ncbi:MAG TPA: AAA family ATPase [Kofleriaceae bacterium]|nr:AAA family ATPase [Kofleriaceae bacterium]
MDYERWRIVTLRPTERRSLQQIYDAWREGRPIDRERALFSVVRSGASPDEARRIEHTVVSQETPALVRFAGANTMTPTLAGAITLLPSPVVQQDLDDLERLVAYLHAAYEPGRQKVSVDLVAGELGLEAAHLERLAELGELAGSPGALLVSQEALFWAPHDRFIARKLRVPPREPLRAPVLPITAEVQQVRWSGLGPFRAPTTLDLGPMTVLVGANGAGKTTALAALDTLRTIALEGLGGIAAHRARVRADADELVLAAVMELERPGAPAGETVEWQLVASPLDRARSETLQRVQPLNRVGELASFDRGTGRWTDASGRLVEHTMRADQLALTTATEPAAQWQLIAMRGSVARWRIELATPQPAFGADLTTSAAEVAHPWRAYLRDPQAFDRLREHVRQVTGLRDVSLADKTSMLALEDASGVWVPVSAASTGIVRVVELLAWLLAPEPPPLLAVDELEQHLHGDLAARLIDVMRSVSHRTRIVVTTHSARVLRCFQPAEVRLVRRDGRGSSIVAVDREPRLRRLLESGDLGDLIQDGYFAGSV